jgi:hypothetical protein
MIAIARRFTFVIDRSANLKLVRRLVPLAMRGFSALQGPVPP